MCVSSFLKITNEIILLFVSLQRFLLDYLSILKFVFSNKSLLVEEYKSNVSLNFDTETSFIKRNRIHQFKHMPIIL